MSSLNNSHIRSNGIVCEGWLTKSPPEKIWKTKWRRRWFVLRPSGHLPDQYVLEYFADASKRKLKGVIDLDQCEQVDAGLQLESRKENFQYMFDVRTSKRTFYLVANCETEMNRWVECICSVCGLKIHVDEGQDDRYSPQPSQENSASNNNNNNISTNDTNMTTSVSSNSTTTITTAPTASTATSTLTFAKSRNSETINNLKNNSKNNTTKTRGVSVTYIEGPSGPYIPISECHTGRPINGSLTDIDSVPQLPTKLSRAVSDECYDIPRQLNPQKDANDRNDSLLDSVPKAPKSASFCNSRMVRKSVNSHIANPPKVNWSTYPRDSPEGAFASNDVTRTSVRSCNASVDVYTRHQSVNESGFDTQRSSSPTCDFNRDSTLRTDSSGQPPPRPPKPPSLRKSKSKSESCASLPNVSQLYDVPITAVEHNLKSDDDSSPTFKSSVCPQSDISPKSPDQLYDFPRMNPSSESTQANECPEMDASVLNATVPITLGSSQRSSSKKHSYTNAPAGYFVNKETVFNYEYRPTLQSSMDDNCNVFANNDINQSDRSPQTPNSASFMNSQISSSLPNSLIVGPPAVNRDLKPRRKGSDSDASNTALPSPTMKKETIQLQPPPALTRIHSAPTKRSFRKPRTSGQTHVAINAKPPRIPSRVVGHQHNREPSTSEDDLSLNDAGSRRNSQNDETTKGSVIPPPRRHLDASEIQYLDLDLDSDNNSQSPRTPNEHNHQRSGSTLSNKELSTSASQCQPPSSGSTVYKTVDFLKTEALNKMRLNLDTYRNSQ